MRFRTGHPIAPVVIEKPDGEVLATADSLPEARALARVIQAGLRAFIDRRHGRYAFRPPAA